MVNLLKKSEASNKVTLGWVVGLLILVGAGIRFWKLAHGLPHVYFTDEGLYVYDALNMGGGDLNTHHFAHPSLYFYLSFFVDVIYILTGLVVGFFKRPGDAWVLYQTNPTPFYLIGRIITATFGVLTIPLVYLIGKKVFNPKTGVLASLFLTFSFLHVQFSQIGNMDVPLTFFCSLTFLLAFFALDKGRVLYFVLSGLAGGIAASTKYQGLETILWGPLACFLLALKNQSHPFRALLGKRCFLFLLFFVLGFTVGTPFWILDFPKFKQDFLWQWSHHNFISGKGQLGFDGKWNWSYYLSVLLSYGLGFPLGAAAILGFIVLILRRNFEARFFISFPLVYFFIAGCSKIRTARYIMPLVPFLCLAAAFLLVGVVEEKMRGEGKRAFLALGLVSALVIFPSLASSLRYDFLRTFPDTRNEAFAWVQGHIPPDKKIVQSFYAFLPSLPTGPRIERLDTTVFRAELRNASSLKTLDEFRKAGSQYLVLDEWHMGTVLVEGSRLPWKYQDNLRRYQKLLKDLDESAQLLVSFSPYRGPQAAFDIENVEVPSRSLWKMKSFGPTIRIYQLSR